MLLLCIAGGNLFAVVNVHSDALAPSRRPRNPPCHPRAVDSLSATRRTRGPRTKTATGAARNHALVSASRKEGSPKAQRRKGSAKGGRGLNNGGGTSMGGDGERMKSRFAMQAILKWHLRNVTALFLREFTEERQQQQQQQTTGSGIDFLWQSSQSARE